MAVWSMRNRCVMIWHIYNTIIWGRKFRYTGEIYSIIEIMTLKRSDKSAICEGKPLVVGRFRSERASDVVTLDFRWCSGFITKRAQNNHHIDLFSIQGSIWLLNQPMLINTHVASQCFCNKTIYWPPMIYTCVQTTCKNCRCTNFNLSCLLNKICLLYLFDPYSGDNNTCAPKA